MNYLAAAVQLSSGRDKAANLACAERLIRLAAARGAALVALPETFNWRGSAAEEPAAAEPLDGPSLSLISRLARELDVCVLAGSITERAANESKSYNTSALVGRDGAVLAVYRKIHLFDIDLPGRVRVQESARKIAGAEAVSVKTPLGDIGLTICYDIRFPE
ncbi:MAG: nitrilase-related carbon-nitrogen hydrolase, partial [Candidatus Binataceae bacterium]